MNENNLLVSDDLENQLIQETNLENIKNIINLFNLNIKKKDIVRVSKLNDLQDKITNQIDKRLTNKCDEFSNSDLINYFKVIQETINKSDTTLDKVDTPSIQIIQNQLNVSAPEDFDKESRQRISDAVQKFLNNYSNEDTVDNNVVDADYEQLEFSFDEVNNVSL